MAVGQAVLAPVLDTGALDAVLLRLEVGAVDRCAAHGRTLRGVLELHRVLSAAGAGVSATAQVALTLQVSEQAAHALLEEAQLLSGFDGGLEALDCGLLTVEQTAVLRRVLAAVSPEVQQTVWHRLRARLLTAAETGVVLPPARLRTQLTAWVVAADPAAAAERRRNAEAEGTVDYRRREDGLVDIWLLGVPSLLAQSVLQRLRDQSLPVTAEDDRTAGKRRLDTALDLLLGRTGIRNGECSASCDCPLHAPVPCGADVAVLIPLGAALGTTDELATLVGHGPLDPPQTQQVLHAAPRMRPVWVDSDGVPVAAGRTVLTPGRDPAAVRQALLTLAALPPPGRRVPRHPDDHRPEPDTDQQARPTGAAVNAVRTTASDADRTSPPDAARDAEADYRRGAAAGAATGAATAAAQPRLLTAGHPAGAPGPYRVPPALRRLLQIRASLCEWPACGHRGSTCDQDHDVAWPQGPTCGCNLGPLCRRHHRVKQTVWTKTRTAEGVRWTDPTGRTWLSPAQHQPPAPAVRRITPLPHEEPPTLSPQQLLDLHAPDDLDPMRYELRANDTDAADVEPAVDDTGWGLALDDPYRWQPHAA